jgi:serine/threonine-protein kinase HipA
MSADPDSAVPVRQLRAWFNDRQVGTLVDTGSVWSFQYTDAWLADPRGFDLSPALRRRAEPIEDGGSARPVQWFFDNLLPEEEARRLLSREARIPPSDAFALLAWYGAESAGALTLLPPDELPAPGGLEPLPPEELSGRIRRLPRHSLTEGAPKRMSMAGAQHKLAVVLQHDQLFEPVGLTASTHILKPDHVDVEQYPHSVANEWFCMALAGALGLPVPPTTIRRVPEPVYLVERFDRQRVQGGILRRHVLDACQLLSLDRALKYQQATPSTMAQLVGACREKARTRQRLFRWLVFNTLVGNGDAHLKNLSFHVEPTGISLAPHYDLLATATYLPAGTWATAELSWRLGAATRFGDVRRSHLVEFGTEIGLPAGLAAKLLDEIRQPLPAAMDRMLQQLETHPAVELAAGELRLLRQVRFGLAEEMLRQTA